MSLFGELGRRNVFRVGIAYAIVAWIVVQVADIVFETIGAPAWVMQTLMLGIGLGFVVALIFAWAYEVTPEGIKREAEIDRTTSITGITARKLDRVIIGLLVVALGYFVWESRLSRPDPTADPSATSAELSEPATEETATLVSDLSIAVLPFENRSSLADDAFFSEGMHDDLLTTLAKIGSMKVISRTSVMEYKNTTKKIPEIAEELGVANILEGGVQRAGNKVRINVQLIDADTDEHLWAEIYDRELTAENLFAIQSEISTAIADALHATLSPEEKESINRAPTDNLDAFDQYIRGRQLMATREVPKLEQATQAFLDAVEMDPEFALAWVGVADSHALLETYSVMPLGSLNDVRRNAVERALAIDSQLGEAYASLGSILDSENQPLEAEQAFTRAIELNPNYATAYHWLANMIDQDLQRVDDALQSGRRAAELDPRSAVILASLAGNTLRSGDFRSVLRQGRRMVEMHPDFAQGYTSLGNAQLELGNWADANDSFHQSSDVDPSYIGAMFNLAYAGALLDDQEQSDAALDVLRDTNERVYEINRLLVQFPSGGDPEARAIIEAELADEPSGFVATTLGDAAVYYGEMDLALQAYAVGGVGDLATVEIDTGLVSRNDNRVCHMAWAMLETDGLEERGQQLVDEALDFFANEFPDTIMHKDRWALDICHLLNGDADAALDVIEQQVAHLHLYNWLWDHQLPMYDAIREHPRYVVAWTAFERHRAEQVRQKRAKENAKPAFEF